MEINEIEGGLKVKVTNLEKTTGMLIKQKHLTVRKVGITGTVVGCVPGHGGEVWMVKHGDTDEIGAYFYTEFEKLLE